MGKALQEKEKAAARERSAARATALRVQAATKAFYIYKPAVMRALCDLVASGDTVERACKALHISQRTVFNWIAVNKEASAMYEAAQAFRTEARVEEAVKIADRSKKPELQVKVRLWDAGKQKPKKYGDQVDHRHSGSVTLMALLAASYDKHVLKLPEPEALPGGAK